MIKGKIILKSSNDLLEKGFNWAKVMALSYSHEGDLVGDWYEAALPDREAFCIRDVAHQSNGAHFLGLSGHTYNMLSKFVENISESKDYCTFWEINRYNQPASVDYRNDEDFWYNLPANFDLVDACFRQYNWTGNDNYLNNEGMSFFYKKTFKEFIQRWDKDGDGIPENQGQIPYRGIASYIESQVGKTPIKVGSDLLSAMYGGYLAYGGILKAFGDKLSSRTLESRAEDIRKIFDEAWWSEANECYYTAILSDGDRLAPCLTNNTDLLTPLPLYFGIIQQRHRIHLSMARLEDYTSLNVETMSYLPDVFFKYGKSAVGMSVLWQLMSPALKRREYPEVSFSVIGNIMTGVLGFSGEGCEKILTTYPQTKDQLEWVEVSDIPIFSGEINYSVQSNGNRQQLCSTIQMTWQVVFAGHFTRMHLNGKYVVGSLGTDSNGYSITKYLVIVEPHITYDIVVKK